MHFNSLKFHTILWVGVLFFLVVGGVRNVRNGRWIRQLVRCSCCRGAAVDKVAAHVGDACPDLVVTPEARHDAGRVDHIARPICERDRVVGSDFELERVFPAEHELLSRSKRRTFREGVRIFALCSVIVKELEAAKNGRPTGKRKEKKRKKKLTKCKCVEMCESAGI